MRNYKKYRTTVIELFSSFLSGKIDKNELMQSLFSLEREFQGITLRSNKTLWFKFYNNDNLVTDLDDIQIDWNWSKEKMQIAIDNPKGLQIYYS